MALNSCCSRQIDCALCPKTSQGVLIYSQYPKGQHFPAEKCTQNCIIFILKGELLVNSEEYPGTTLQARQCILQAIGSKVELLVNSAEEIAGIPSSWPGTDLTVGSSGTKVRQIQQQLARISQAYPAIPTIAADGIFGERTREAVEAFQRIFDLPVTGVVDFPTWYKISQIYVGVTRIAELN